MSRANTMRFAVKLCMLSTIRFNDLPLRRLGGGTVKVSGLSYKRRMGKKKYRVWWCAPLKGQMPPPLKMCSATVPHVAGSHPRDVEGVVLS